jgi:hypothetical protein
VGAATTFFMSVPMCKSKRKVEEQPAKQNGSGKITLGKTFLWKNGDKICFIYGRYDLDFYHFSKYSNIN